MKFRILLALVVTFIALSCEEDHDTDTPNCSVENPVEELAWLAAEIRTARESDLSKYSYVSQATLGSETVFMFPNCCPFCNSMVPVYNCAGERLGNIGQDGLEPELLEGDVVIWKPEDSECFN